MAHLGSLGVHICRQGKAKEAIEAHINAIPSPKALEGMVFHCNTSKCFDKAQLKFQINVQESLKEVLSHICDALLQSGAVKKCGRAPKGSLERELQALVDAQLAPA